MKLAISNIAWSADNDQTLYAFLKSVGFSGLEIAPTRIFENRPYDQLTEASRFSGGLKKEFGLEIASMQSICFGISESIFGTPDERQIIFDYTKKAIDFAAAVNCNNLVFGCPKNRIIGENQTDVAVNFFTGLGNYAAQKGTVLALEANPVIYGTDFINTSQESFDFVREINSKGLKVNFDFGTFLYNQEKLADVEKNLDLVHHIHISEPYLEIIQKREIHKDLAEMLRQNHYGNYVSVEMKNQENTENIKQIIHYTKNLFDVS